MGFVCDSSTAHANTILTVTWLCSTRHPWELGNGEVERRGSQTGLAIFCYLVSS